MFGNLGFSEILVITVIALVVFGPQRLPEIARTVAKALNQFRRTATDLRETVEREVDVRDFREAFEGVRAAASLPQEILARTLARANPDAATALPAEPDAAAVAAAPPGSVPASPPASGESAGIPAPADTPAAGGAGDLVATADTADTAGAGKPENG